jgi:WD40 repeat protein
LSSIIVIKQLPLISNRYTCKLLVVPWIASATLGACTSTPSPTAPVITALPVELPTVLPSATAPIEVVNTHTPGVTPLPTVTVIEVEATAIASPLVSDGPYLVYSKKVGDKTSIVLLEPDASGREIIELPAGSFISGLSTSVSPDGQWLAFYSGHPRDIYEINGTESVDLSLNLMRLADKQTFLVTPLLSNNFPENFEETVHLLFEKYPNDFSLAQLPATIRAVFFGGIFVLDWSPNGRYSAFAGEMDGPSVDLYLLDVATQSIQRMTDGPDQVQWLAWSPDMQWILHASAEFLSAGDYRSYHVLSVQDKTVKTLLNVDSFGGPNRRVGWASNSLCTIHTVANGLNDKAHLRNIDVVKDRVVELWPGQFTSFAYDPLNNILAVRVWEENNIAIVMVNPANGQQQVVEAGFWDIKFWDHDLYRFIATSKTVNDPGVIAIQQDGTIIKLSDPAWALAISPDPERIAFYDNTVNPGMEIYFADNSETLAITDMPVDNVIWRRDSEGNLYYAALSDGKPILVDSGVGNANNFSATWIDGR